MSNKPRYSFGDQKLAFEAAPGQHFVCPGAVFPTQVNFPALTNFWAKSLFFQKKILLHMALAPYNKSWFIFT